MIAPSDAPKLVTGLHALSENTRFYRFFFLKKVFTSDELRTLTNCDGISQCAMVAELPDAANRPLIAVARWIRDASEPTTADVAFVTRDDWQKRGVGVALVRTLADNALQRGITRFRAQTLWGNLAAIKLLETIGTRKRRRPIASGVAELVYELRSNQGDI